MYGGLIQGNSVKQTIESGIYLASSSSDGNNGCQGFLVSGNDVNQACNNSYLVIGGKDNIISNNVARAGFNTGVQLWHCCQTTVSGNTIEKCNSKIYNGLGVLSDAWAGGLFADGDDNISGSATYQCKIFDNQVTECGQGRAASNYAIRVANDPFAVNPDADKVYVGGNQSSDADVHFQNDQSCTIIDMDTRQPDVTALQVAVTALEALHPANPIRVVEPNANDDDVPVLASDTFLLIKHSEKTGLTATLPSDAVNGSTVIIKNYQYGDGSEQGLGTDFKITVRPAQGQSPAHTIDYKFSHLELNANSLTSGDYGSENEACKLLYYHADRTWLAIQDSY